MCRVKIEQLNSALDRPFQHSIFSCCDAFSQEWLMLYNEPTIAASKCLVQAFQILVPLVAIHGYL